MPDTYPCQGTGPGSFEVKGSAGSRNAGLRRTATSSAPAVNHPYTRGRCPVR